MDNKKEKKEKIDIKSILMKVATEALKDNSISASSQVDNLMNYAATNGAFARVVTSQNPKVINELKTQFKFICELGLDIAKGRKLVYVKTRNLNVAPKGEQKDYLTMPDIQTSYHALILILTRSKSIKGVHVFHTYENYGIDFAGDPTTTMPTVKSWEVKLSDRGKYTGCFVSVKMADGDIATSYHHSADIFATHRKHSTSKGVWDEHELAMVAKAAILDAFRYIPMLDVDTQTIVEHYETNQDYDKEEVLSDEQIETLSKMADDAQTDLIALFEYLKKDKWQDVFSSQYQEAYNFISTQKADIVGADNEKD